MKILFIQLSDDAYISITKKNDPYDWFCDPGPHIFKYKIVMLNSDNIDQYYCFYCIFDQIKSALLSIRN